MTTGANMASAKVGDLPNKNGPPYVLRQSCQITKIRLMSIWAFDHTLNDSNLALIFIGKEALKAEKIVGSGQLAIGKGNQMKKSV